MTKDNFNGIIPYLISPIDKDTGQVRTEVLNNLVEDLINKGVHGLSPLGSTGEVHYLNWNQKVEIVQTVIDSTNKRVPVIPGVTAYTAESAIEQIHYFEKMGVDGVVLLLNTYFKLSESDIITFFRDVSRAVSTPIVIYNNPQFTNIDLTPEIIVTLSIEENIKYFKDATGNTGRLLTILNNPQNNIKIFSASAHIPLFVMAMGGMGWMAGPACIFPEKSVLLYDLIKSGEWEQAYKIQKTLWNINELFQKYSLASCIKGALEIQGYDVGGPISPLRSLSNQDKKAIEEIMHSVNKKKI